MAASDSSSTAGGLFISDSESSLCTWLTTTSGSGARVSSRRTTRSRRTFIFWLAQARWFTFMPHRYHDCNCTYTYTAWPRCWRAAFDQDWHDDSSRMRSSVFPQSEGGTFEENFNLICTTSTSSIHYLGHLCSSSEESFRVISVAVARSRASTRACHAVYRRLA